MTVPDRVRVLLVEDNEDDAWLIIRQLRRAGLDVTFHRVQTAEDMAAELATHPPDLVISDNRMPLFDATAALGLLNTTDTDIPFLVVSGQIGEEAAATLMRAGARDFILKDSLARLAPAVQRELDEAHERSERRRAQTALHHIQQQLRLLTQHLRDVAFRYRLRPTPTLEYISPAIADLTGQDPTALYADPEAIFSAIAPEDREVTRAAWWSPPSQPLTTRWTRPDGAPAWIEQRLVPVHGPQNTLIAVEGILRDTTDLVRAAEEREELARQLHQAERLDSLGQLAGGVAHDFNNLLNIIISYADFILDALDPDDSAREDADKILAAAGQAAALTRQLLLFSRLQPAQPEIVDINIVVSDIERLLRRTIGEDIEFVILADPTIGPVSVERPRLEQVLMNLVINARFAMPDGGRLTIQTSAVPTPTRPEPDQLPEGPGQDAVCLTVTDTGCGMDEQTQRRAFEPFFTTKGRGRGTGLGLATVYGVITDAGGTITLRSAPGRGTTFTICLPTTTASSEQPDAADDAGDDRGRLEHIVVVEDDDGVREIIRRILTRANYHVTDVSSRHDALAILDDTATPIDLLLSDIVMPGMPAPQFLNTVRRLRPHTPVICISGYGADDRGGVLPADIPVILKPFDAGTLLRHLRTTLDHRATQGQQAIDAPGEIATPAPAEVGPSAVASTSLPLAGM